MTNFVSRFVKDESGATAIEYGLIAALMAVAVIACLTVFGPKLKTAFADLGATLEDAKDTDITAGT